MKHFHKKVYIYGAIIVVFLMTMLTLIATACFIEPERQESPKPNYTNAYVEVQPPEPETIVESIHEIVEEVAEEPIEEPLAETIEESIIEPEDTVELVSELPIEESEVAESIEGFAFKPYDIPLSVDLQRYTYDLCIERGLDFEVVLALMYAESSYRPGLISATNDYGLMQINEVHHGWLISELGITDFLDAKQNIKAGTFLLANITKKYSDTHQILMVYNFGEAGAKNCWNKGIYSSKYSRKITTKADELKNR